MRELKGKIMAGKKYNDALRRFDRSAVHESEHAFEMIRTFASAKFDESVEVSVRLGVDPRKADQMVRGTIALPSGTGQDVRVAVFAEGDAAVAAQEAGADVVGGADLAEQIEGGFTEFDVAIATPEMMPTVGKLGRVLGPRGLMPNPKSGTVTPDVGKAVGEFKGGKVEYRTDKFGNVALAIGKVSFDAADLHSNFIALMDELVRVRPASTKGRYVKKITVSSTMGPGIHVDHSSHGG